MVAASSGTHLRARIPECTAGCNVLTRPPMISGCFVISLTSTTPTPASRMVRAVPPVDTISQPSAASPRAKSTMPVLSETLRIALGMQLLTSHTARQFFENVGIKLMFYFQYTRGQGLRSICRQHRHFTLLNNIAFVVSFVHVMHSCSTLLFACLQHRTMHINSIHAFATKARQQRWMNVDDAVRITAYDGRRYELQETSERDQVDVGRFECREQLPRNQPNRPILHLDVDCFDVCTACTLQCA